MDEDIRIFLSRFAADHLVERKVLVRHSRVGHLLMGYGVSPLIALMKDNNVDKLQAVERNWFLTSNGEFSNPSSGELKMGTVEQLANPGNIFNLQNRHINPFFGVSGTENLPDIEPEELMETTEYSAEIKFGLERDLQKALRAAIQQLEAGLKIIDGGAEKAVEAGRIDITAEDQEGHLVVIELKSGTAQPESIAQLLAYMGTIENEDRKTIRGILVANDFHPRVVYAAQAVPNISLKAYSFQFLFSDR